MPKKLPTQKQIKELTLPILSKYPDIKIALLVGAYGKGIETESSSISIVTNLDKRANDQNYDTLQTELSNLFPQHTVNVVSMTIGGIKSLQGTEYKGYKILER